MVTEPSLSGLHDLRRVLDLAAHFTVPAQVCINKFDLSPRLTREIETHCGERGVPVIGRIPFEPRMGDAQNAGRSLLEYAPPSDAASVIRSIWHRLERRLGEHTVTKG